MNLKTEALPGGGGGGGGVRVACLNFKMSRVGVLSVLHVAVGNLMNQNSLSLLEFKVRKNGVWCGK